MADYPNTNSILDSKTRTGLSTQILILVGTEPVGAVQSFSESQSKSTKKIGEVGTDGFVEIVPSSQTTISLDLDRVVFDGLSLTESLSRGYRNIAAQRIPFDIVVIDKFSSSSEADWIVTTYHNCWFESLSKSYTQQDYVISEKAKVAVEYMSTARSDDAVGRSAPIEGLRQLAHDNYDDVEMDADAGIDGRRGAMDFNGIFEAMYPE
jgi:hypothetical protein